MSLYVKLDKSIDANYLISKIQKLIQGVDPQSILCIEIRSITGENIDLIPKLEYKKTPDDSGV